MDQQVFMGVKRRVTHLTWVCTAQEAWMSQVTLTTHDVLLPSSTFANSCLHPDHTAGARQSTPWYPHICSHPYVFYIHTEKSRLSFKLAFPWAGDLRDAGSIPGLGRAPGGGKWQSTPVCLPAESFLKIPLKEKKISIFHHWTTVCSAIPSHPSIHTRTICQRPALGKNVRREVWDELEDGDWHRYTIDTT